MKKPRADVVVRKFLAGEKLSTIATSMTGDGMTWLDAITYVERSIRRALNRKRGQR